MESTIIYNVSGFIMLAGGLIIILSIKWSHKLGGMSGKYVGYMWNLAILLLLVCIVGFIYGFRTYNKEVILLRSKQIDVGTRVIVIETDQVSKVSEIIEDKYLLGDRLYGIEEIRTIGGQ